LALLSPRAQLNAMRVSLDAERHRLGAAARHQVERRGIELELAQSLLHALDPHSLMTRGYARVSLESTGESVRTAAMLKPGDGIRATFADGVAEASVDAVRNEPVAQ
ncbi:MAG: exodeoxyribonuclease VII large subunit, partial [Chloroflexota bacterium]|nr:exodeoxyribonuclease VII large subunit [Chloroflexota bacterium]